jgi:exopolysaccharide biosynthesis polyprenyl glycosylphosphotransferase
VTLDSNRESIRPQTRVSAAKSLPAREPDLLTDASLSRPIRIDAIRALWDRVLVAAPATAAVAVLAKSPLRSALLTALVFLSAARLLSSRPPRTTTFTQSRQAAVAPLLGVGILALLHALTGYPALGGLDFLALLVVAAATGALSHVLRPWGPDRQLRTAVIGSGRSAADLTRELRLARVRDYAIVGRIEASAGGGLGSSSEIPVLGTLERLSALVETHQIDLLVMTGEAPRFEVFERIASSCLHLPVRLWEVSGFCEEVLGRVPLAEINSAWFQYIVHPKYRPGEPAAKRALDVIVAIVAGVAFLPVLAILALLIRRDGGPVFFKQVRIGEGGLRIAIYKLRTMRETPDEVGPRWAADDDPRVTKLGRFLRRSHLDEMPQLLNVMRGEMSLVGPRPEQPEFVDRLEEAIPFYSRRHLVKPGITGWAQVRCGYASSDVASVRKLSHDLYYLKHRSLSFDLILLGETVRSVFAIQPNAVREPTRHTLDREGAGA